MTWGNKWSGEGSNAVVYVSPSTSLTFTHTHTHTLRKQKNRYTALQPLTSGVVSWIMVTLNHGNDVHGVKAPGWEIAVGGAIVVVGLIFVTVLGRRDGDSSSASTKNNVDEENNESPFEPLLEQHKIMGSLDCDEGGDGGDDGDDS